MAQVAITFDKRTYRFTCADEDAARLEHLAEYVKETLGRLVDEHGSVRDERLILMAALTITDELFEARADIDDLLDDQGDRLKGVTVELSDENAVSETAALARRK